LRSFVVSDEILAERYFVIPHLVSERGSFKCFIILFYLLFSHFYFILFHFIFIIYVFILLIIFDFSFNGLMLILFFFNVQLSLVHWFNSRPGVTCSLVLYVNSIQLQGIFWSKLSKRDTSSDPTCKNSKIAL